jgi:hypothetical protein
MIAIISPLLPFEHEERLAVEKMHCENRTAAFHNAWKSTSTRGFPLFPRHDGEIEPALYELMNWVTGSRERSPSNRFA